MDFLERAKLWLGKAIDAETFECEQSRATVAIAFALVAMAGYGKNAEVEKSVADLEQRLSARVDRRMARLERQANSAVLIKAAGVIERMDKEHRIAPDEMAAMVSHYSDGFSRAPSRDKQIAEAQRYVGVVDKKINEMRKIAERDDLTLDEVKSAIIDASF